VRFDLAPERRTKAAQAAIQQATISPALERSDSRSQPETAAQRAAANSGASDVAMLRQ